MSETYRTITIGNTTITELDRPAFVPPVLRYVSQLAFLSRFSDAEAVAIDLASIGATTDAATIRRYQAKINAAQYIDLDFTETRVGVQALETAGLIGIGRAAVILDADITEAERP